MGKPVLMERVYVWEKPVRLYHWINALAVLILIVTGYIIGKPVTLSWSAEAYATYTFGIVRFAHFAAAFVFFFNFVFRIYWGFVGNKYAKWDNFVPLTAAQWKRHAREAVQVLRTDVLLSTKGEIQSIGHNAVAGWTYFLSFLAFLFQSVTGFGLYAAMSDATLPKMFAWIVPLMGGDLAVRQWHHAFMWFFVLFSIVHVYLTFYHDYVEGRGVISSMAGGWKFIEHKESRP